jgi:hypothetical protein
MHLVTLGCLPGIILGGRSLRVIKRERAAQDGATRARLLAI